MTIFNLSKWQAQYLCYFIKIGIEQSQSSSETKKKQILSYHAFRPQTKAKQILKRSETHIAQRREVIKHTMWVVISKTSTDTHCDAYQLIKTQPLANHSLSSDCWENFRALVVRCVRFNIFAPTCLLRCFHHLFFFSSTPVSETSFLSEYDKFVQGLFKGGRAASVLA